MLEDNLDPLASLLDVRTVSAVDVTAA